MADNFNFKTFLVENKLGAYSKDTISTDEAKEEHQPDPTNPADPHGLGMDTMAGVFEEGSGSALGSLNNLESALMNLKKNVATDSTIGTESKEGLLRAFEEMMEDIQTIGYDLEAEDEPDFSSDYMKRRAGEMNEASNPEGDKLVKRFLDGIAKKFDYQVEDAARFVKETIKRLGY